MGGFWSVAGRVPAAHLRGGPESTRLTRPEGTPRQDREAHASRISRAAGAVPPPRIDAASVRWQARVIQIGSAPGVFSFLWVSLVAQERVRGRTTDFPGIRASVR